MKTKRFISYLLAFCLLLTTALPAGAALTEKAPTESRAKRISHALYELTSVYDSASGPKKAQGSGKGGSSPEYDPDGSYYQTARLIVKSPYSQDLFYFSTGIPERAPSFTPVI
ncbi:MAG: hypothetical protein IJS90_06635 [Clostridia bacterium]|nr:hypothetical protein [Clostridia bacterium]